MQKICLEVNLLSYLYLFVSIKLNAVILFKLNTVITYLFKKYTQRILIYSCWEYFNGIKKKQKTTTPPPPH